MRSLYISGLRPFLCVAGTAQGVSQSGHESVDTWWQVYGGTGEMSGIPVHYGMGTACDEQERLENQTHIMIPYESTEGIDEGVAITGFLMVWNTFNQDFPRDASIPDITRRACHRMPHQNMDELRECYINKLRDGGWWASAVMYVSGNTKRLADGRVYFLETHTTPLSDSDFHELMRVFDESDDVKEAKKIGQEQWDASERERYRKKREAHDAEMRESARRWRRMHPIKYRLGMIPEYLKEHMASYSVWKETVYGVRHILEYKQRYTGIEKREMKK
jgi:hypothetical protein